MKKSILLTALLSLLLLSSFAYSEPGHMGAGGAKQPMKMASTDVFVDGLQATFMVMLNQNHRMMLSNMNMKEEIPQNTSHNVMVVIKDEDTGRELSGIPVTIQVTDPDDNEQSKTGSYKEMMKTYDAYFNLQQKGKYKIRVLFETQGQKRSIGISYDAT